MATISDQGDTPPSRDGKGGELHAALRRFRLAFAGVGAFSAISNILMLTAPFFMLEIYDRVLPSGSIPTLLLLGALVAMLFMAQGVVDWIRGRLLTRIAGSLDESLSGRAYATLLRMSLVRGRAEGLEPVRDLDSIRSFLGGLGPTALFDLPWIPFYIGIVALFHPLLGLLAFAGAVVLIIVTIVAEWMTKAPTKAAIKSGATRHTLAEAGRRNAEAVTAMGFGGTLVDRWRGANRDYVKNQQRAGDVAGGFGTLSKTLRMMLQSAVLGLGAYLVIVDQASAGVIIAASILTARALAPVDLAIANWKGFVAAREGWKRLGRLFAVLPADEARLDLPAPSAMLALDGVTLIPPGDSRVTVHGVSLTLAAGQGLGIIGPSGSGKSSLARALVGIWPMVRGSVRLDGATLDQWPEQNRGRHVGYLPQEVELFAGTIAENISRFDPDASAEAIVAAAEKAGVHELIVGFRSGYETEIGEEGAMLSAGQRQRIALARALYRDPFLVVLDEPNSNLDGEGEAALTRAIADTRRRGGIVVVIAHRPSALAATDTILVMRDGRAEKLGPKDEILRTLVRPAAPRPAHAMHAEASATQITRGASS